jgi:hypothetical protein
MTRRPLSENDIDAAAASINCDPACIRALLAVESAGVGFGPGGWPIILFEPHQFYKRVSPELRDRAVAAGVAYPKWGARPYPRMQAARYAQLANAVEIDRIAALSSTSWGLGQLMGFNFAACGYADVVEMVEAMHMSEAEQLAAMMRFLVTLKLDAPLRERRWADFARGYNGAGYKAHAYDLRLEATALRNAGQGIGMRKT